MKFIKEFNQIALFAVLVVVFGTVGLHWYEQSQCPGSKSTYRSLCSVAIDMSKMGMPMTESDYENCKCAQ